MNTVETQYLGRLAGGQSVGEVSAGMLSGAAGVGQLVRTQKGLEARILGMSPQVAKVLETPGVTDLLINGPGEAWIDRGAGMEPEPSVRFADVAELRAAAVRMASACGRRLDDSMPIVDATLPGGVRLHAVLPPLSGDSPVVSLRVLGTGGFSLPQLRESGTLSAEVEEILRALVEERATTVISGSTGSGKTTLLMALLGLVSPADRIICIEEAIELRPRHPHVVHLQERSANVQSVGAVSMSELVRASLRMRPDRIVLGEARGAEIREVLSALNTGHEGGFFTLHANTALDVPSRLVALGALAGMSPEVVALQAVSGIDAIVHLRRERGGGRRWVSQIATLALGPANALTAQLAWETSPDGRGRPGPAWEKLRARLEIPASRRDRSCPKHG